MSSPRRESRRDPAAAPPPGDELRLWLITERRTQKWAACQLGISTKHLSQIITGKSGYSVALGARIAALTGTRPEHWMHMLVAYQIAQLEGRDER